MKGKSVVRWLWILPLICVFFLICISASAAQQSAKASAMQLMKTEGSVNIANNTGKSLPLLEKMRLYNGYSIATNQSSYAWINLDDTKLIKMDAVSQASVQKSGKKLEVRLNSGALFFDVSEPLTADETLNIRVSTTIVGIRGTSGWIRIVDSNTAQIAILDGSVTCTTSDPVTGQTQTSTISGGQVASCSVQNGSSITTDPLQSEDVPGFVLTDVVGNTELCDRIQESSGMDFHNWEGSPEERLRQDENAARQELNRIESSRRGQTGNISTSPVWNTGTGSSVSEASSRSERPSSSSSEVSDSGESSESSSSSSSVSSELTMPVSASEIQEALDVHDRVRVQ